MFNSVCTSRVSDFRNHFSKPNLIDIPDATFKNHPIIKDIPAENWLQCKYFINIYILNNDFTYFYCSDPRCNRWYSTSGTIGNIKKHIQHKHWFKESEIKELADIPDSEINEDATEIKLSDEIDELLSNQFKKMILKTGRPFSMVENPDMQFCLKKLGSRNKLVKKCEKIAENLKSQMKYILNSGSFISIAIDEWSDLNKRRYLGVTARCLYDGEIQVLFIALDHVTEVHANNDIIKERLFTILNNYQIRGQVMNAVSDNCGTMIKVFQNTDIIRFPCGCHLLSSLMKHFLKPSEKIIHEISAAIHHLKSSTCYAALRDDFDDPHIITYTEIRWVSLYDSLKSLIKCQKSIHTFYIDEIDDNIENEEEESDEIKHVQRLEERHWEFIEMVLPLLKAYKSAIKLLESDDFGTVSLVINSLYRIKDTVENLPADLFGLNIQKFNDAFSKKMNKYKDQLHPLYDAAVLLNPYIENDHIDIEKGIKFIESKMKEFGWKEEEEKTSKNKTMTFLNPNLENSHRKKGPLQRYLDLGFMIPDIEENDKHGLGRELFNFWKRRLDYNQDKILAKVAIGILNVFCTSCSAERLFSKAGRVLTRDRMKLMSDIAESQILIMANSNLAEQFIKFSYQ